MSKTTDELWHDLWHTLWANNAQTNLGWFRRAMNDAGYRLIEMPVPTAADPMGGGRRGVPMASLTAAAVAAHAMAKEAAAQVAATVWSMLPKAGMEFIPVAPPTRVPSLEPSEALLVQRLVPDATVRYNHPGDVGYDLVCQERVDAVPDRVTYVACGVAVKLPPRTWGLIWSRSSATKRNLLVMPGIIDNGYTGPLFAAVVAIGEPQLIEAGTRIAQLLVLPMMEFQPPVAYVDDLPETERGANGFGSTGT